MPGRPLYQFRRMPFGLCNAAQTMCRLMDKVMGTDLRDSVFVYIDDLLIVSPNFESHIVHLKTVAERLRRANLTINVAKSRFVMKEIRYLGYIVGNGQLKTDPIKVQAIVDFPTPKTVKQIRRFVGMTGWYQRFIRNFSALAAPMTDLVGKAGKFEWTTAADDAFNSLKNCLCSAPVLVQPDFTKRFFVQCDASIVGVGSVLFQYSDDGHEHPIAYFSKKLNGAQKNYSITELECYAAVLSVKHFRPYIELMPFTVITDHASLKWLMGQKDLGGRLCRWSLKLQAFDFEIEHRKGTANIVPDALSRMHVEEVEVALVVDLESVEFDSEEYKKLRTDVEKNCKQLPDVEIRGRHVYRRTLPRSGDLVADQNCWKLWIPSTLTNNLVESAHSSLLSAHRGVAKTFDLLRRSFFWPGMAAQVYSFVTGCVVCKETKAPNQTLRPLMGQQMPTERSWQKIYTDLLGPYPRSKLGNTMLLIVLDHFSKFVLLKPLRKANSGAIVSYLEDYVFHTFGTPESIVSDNGVQYVSKDFADCLKRYGIRHIRTAIHAPQSNASERVNRSILAAIRTTLGTDQRDWDKNISAISAAFRNSVHEATGFSPYYILFGQHMAQHGSVYTLSRLLGTLPVGDIEVLPSVEMREIVRRKVTKNLADAYDRNKKTYDRRSREVSFQPGQEVFRRVFAQSNFQQNFNAKLGKQWLKARIARRIGNNMYQLEDQNGKPISSTYHAKDLKQ